MPDARPPARQDITILKDGFKKKKKAIQLRIKVTYNFVKRLTKR